MKKSYLFSIFLCIIALQIFAQGKFDLQNADEDKIRFKLINNLIVIPVEVNGVELSFLLDTGVSKPIIFNFLNLSEELHINKAELIYLRGLGEGETVEALKSKNNIFRIGKAININQDLYAVFDPALNFAPMLGVPIHGIIGYDILKDFIVEINYSSKYIKLYDPLYSKPKKCKKCETLNLSFYNNKPYITAEIGVENDDMPVKLLIDTGGSDALWLFEDEKKQIYAPEKYFDDFLGRGLSGSVYGKRAKLEIFRLKSFELNDVNVAFPDSISIAYAKKIKDRNGSLSGEILKRFNIIFDYQKAKITLRKNNNFRNPFFYNKSGITIEHAGVRVVKERGNRSFIFGSIDSADNNSATQSTVILSGSYKYSLTAAFTVVELREDSPAKNAGIEIGDIVLSVNGKEAHLYSLQEIIQMFFGDTGKRISLLVDRDGIRLKIHFRLENLL
jgi:hypothetical protein